VAVGSRYGPDPQKYRVADRLCFQKVRPLQFDKQSALATNNRADNTYKTWGEG